MQRRAVTIADVASAAGVSKMTVSNVLSNNQASHRHVSQQTRERVLAAVQTLRYRPNANALSLRRRCTNIIGVYTGHGYINAENAFLAALIGGLQEGCDRHEKDLLVHGAFPGRSAADIYAELADGRIDGLALYSPTDDPLGKLLSDSHLPVVALTDAVPGLPAVVVDDVQGARLTMEYLAAKGHRHIIYQACTQPLMSAVRRLEACCEFGRANGMQVKVQPTPHFRNRAHISDEAVTWLDLPVGQRPTAAVCWNDLTAYDLLEQCERRGLRAPEDVAIVGFDDVISLRGMRRRLTTIHAPWAEVARTAIDLLVRQFAGEEIAPETVLPVHLVLGDTA
jgi:DNA-binding LacI/PurR family transcriptional regulator